MSKPDSRRALIPILLLAGVVGVIGVLLFVLMDRRLAQGDLFPEYSTYRADALGTKALYDSFTLLPPVEVSRWTQPLSRLDTTSPILLFKLGAPSFFGLLEEEKEAIRQVARSGGRVVLALDPITTLNFLEEAAKQQEVRQQVERMTKEMRGDNEEEDNEENAETEENDNADEPEADQDKPKPDSEEEAEPEEELTAERRAQATFADSLFAIPEWGLSLEPYNWRTAVVYTRKDGAPFATATEKHDWHPLPILSLMAWKITPEQADEWETLFAIDDKPVVIRREFGQGDLILMTDPFALSNEALWTGLHEGREDYRNADFLAWLVGDHARVRFDEFGLGIADTEGVGTLARRYNLHAALALLVLIVALFIWRNGCSLVPPSEAGPEETESLIGHASHTGMQLLMQRAVPRQALLPTCHELWSRSAGQRAPEKVRTAVNRVVEEQNQLPPRKRDPLAAAGRILAILQNSRKL